MPRLDKKGGLALPYSEVGCDSKHLRFELHGPRLIMEDLREEQDPRRSEHLLVVAGVERSKDAGPLPRWNQIGRGIELTTRLLAPRPGERCPTMDEPSLRLGLGSSSGK